MLILDKQFKELDEEELYQTNGGLGHVPSMDHDTSGDGGDDEPGDSGCGDCSSCMMCYF